MRSSKSRSRSKQNRPRPLGNIVNRVFDSSGPEGKVRGTPQQIIEKYLVLARDAQLSNDRVAAENFLQHAEHYTRMLAEAQRELQAEQEARRGFGGHGQGQGYTNGNGGDRGPGDHRGAADRSAPDRSQAMRPEAEDRRGAFMPVLPFDETAADPRDDGGPDTGLVETPEMRAGTGPQPAPARDPAHRRDTRPDRREDAPRSAAPRTEGQRDGGPSRSASAGQAGRAPAEATAQSGHAPDEPVAPEAPSGAAGGEPRPRRSRSPRKPKAEAPVAAAGDAATSG